MKICRKSIRPQAALQWLAKNALQDIATENILEARMDGARAVINISGSIGKSWWDDSGITAAEFDEALNEIPKGTKILLRVNSEGGSIKEGTGIYDSIDARSEDITARISGYALSIASIFPLAASRIESPDHSIWMVHEGWMNASGNKRDMLKNAEMLSTHDETMAGIYAKRTGKSKDYWKAKMENETWFTGPEAIAAGLAHSSGEKDEAEASGRRPIFAEYLASCRNIPANIFNMLSPNSATPLLAGNTNQQTQENKMKKSILVALLNTHGIINKTTQKPFAESDTDADFETGLESLASKKMQKDSSAENLADIKALRDEIKAIKESRVADKINAEVDAGKITKKEAKILTAQALISAEAEREVFDMLAERELPSAGVIAGAHVEIVDGPNMSENGVQGSKILPELENIFKATKDVSGSRPDGTPLQAVARYDAMKREFPNLLRAALRKDRDVRGENTFSGTVTTNFLIMGVITKLYNRFAPAAIFTRDSETDPFKPLAAGIRKFNVTVTDGSDVGKNVTNFETLAGGTAGNDDSTINAVTITPDQYTAGGHITNSQLNSGFRVADVLEAKLAGFADKITQVLTTPITVANFTTNAPVIVAPGAFGFSDLATLQGTLKKTIRKNLLLDGEYIARISNAPGFFQKAGLVGGDRGAWAAYGWDNIALNTEWSGAGANVRGFGCGENAIGIISGLPLNPPEGIPGNIVQTGVARIPDVDIAIATYAWFSAQARTFFFTYDIILGATLIDESQGVLVKSA